MHKRVDPKPQAQGAAPRVPSFLSIDFVGLYLVICVDETFVLTQIGASPASGRAKQEDDAIRAAHTPPGHMFMNEGIEASVPLALTLNVCMNVRFWEHIQTKLLFGRTMSHVPTMAARFILLFSKPRAASAFPSNPELKVTLPPTISSAAGSNRPRVQRSGGESADLPLAIQLAFSYLGHGPFRSRWLLSARPHGVGPADAWVFAAWRFWVPCDFLSPADGFFPIQSTSIHVIHPVH
jgi:hypothetical protein